MYNQYFLTSLSLLAHGTVHHMCYTKLHHPPPLTKGNELLLLSRLISREFVCYSCEFACYSRDCHVVTVVFKTMDEDSLEADEGNSEEEYSDSESLEILHRHLLRIREWICGTRQEKTNFGSL